MTAFDIWYMKPEWFVQGIHGRHTDNLEATHIFLKTLELPGGQAQLERVFHDMQGEIWSPNGEARELIEKLGLGHTSMSVGDVIIVNQKAWMVSNFGFEELDELVLPAA